MSAMTFTISRVSGHLEVDENNPPHGRAELGSVTTWMYWTFKTISDAKRKHPDREFERVGGRIRSCDGTARCWEITFRDLDDLIEWCDDVGDVVIGRHWQNHEVRHLEIYDGYRE